MWENDFNSIFKENPNPHVRQARPLGERTHLKSHKCLDAQADEPDLGLCETFKMTRAGT